MTFAEQIVYAMFKPSKYKEMVELKKGRFVAFVIALMLAVGIVREVIPTAAFITGFGGFESLFTEKMSDMIFRDGELSIEEPFNMTISTLRIIIDTDDAKVANSKLSKTGAYIAIGSKYFSAVVNNEGDIRYRDTLLTALLPEGFSNKTLKNMIPMIYAYLVLSSIFYCVGCFIKYAILALVFSLFLGGVNKTAGLGLSSGRIFEICFYGQTLGIIISNFTAALGILPDMIVSFICVLISIGMITSGFMSVKGPRGE